MVRPAIPRSVVAKLMATRGDRKIGMTALLTEAIEAYVASKK